MFILRLRAEMCFLLISLILLSTTTTAMAEESSWYPGKRLREFLSLRNQKKENEENISAKILVKTDIYYSKDRDSLKSLDIYLPQIPQSLCPTIIYIHGGGWKRGDKKGARKHGLFYGSKGIVFISLNYRLSPEHKHPVQAEDCAEAVNWVLANVKEIGIEEKSLYLSGHSAGAHLAALLATDPSYLGKYNIPVTTFKGVIPVDTASFDLLSEGNENFVKDLVKVNFGTDLESLRQASPIHRVKDNGNYPPFLILASANRMPVVTQGKILVGKLQKSGSIAIFEAIDDHNHRKMNMGMFTEGSPVSRAILKFISP